MCGICGAARPDLAEPLSLQLLKNMCRTIIHRGPDDQGIHIEPGAALGVRRLSIIDVEGGHQPLSNEEGTVWAAHNGEVYNFPELRKELESAGHVFRTRTDTETLVHAYEEWGRDFVHKLRGMYAFALWDGRRKKLFLVRDRVGIKPLYYTTLKDGSLVFGSELKSLLFHPGVERVLNSQALDLFLTLEYIPAPLSIFKNIYKLPAGCLLVYEKGKVAISKYWDVPSPPGEKSPNRLEELQDELYELLKESIRLRLISDVPLGAFLSGGIDSSAVVGLMHLLKVDPLLTFSVGFTDSSYNELDHARRVAAKFETQHEEFFLQPQALSLTEKLILHLDEPFGDFSVFPTFMISQTARSRVKVILSGDGGDELFAGYEHYQAQKLGRWPAAAPVGKSIFRLLQKCPPSPKKKGFWNKLRRFSQGFEVPTEMRHFRWMMFLSQKTKQKLYSEDLARAVDIGTPYSRKSPFQELFDRSLCFDPISGELYLDFKTYLADDILVKVDRMSMAPSLETRVPFLDHKVVEFAFRLPGRLKLKGLKTKWILKKTMERLLPRENTIRPKEGFSIPMKHWLRTELKDILCDHLNEKRISEQGFFKPEEVKRLIEAHMAGRENNSHQLWCLLVFALWKDKYLSS
ncbi:MAG: asparagine synthase (glutamine-hydrolyzing) [Candidatus Aminicenantes bacterium]|nr:asparagine synthase (glutamine-hydrolyzing) [Candidatus Aminicenantes bacterium]